MAGNYDKIDFNKVFKPGSGFTPEYKMMLVNDPKLLELSVEACKTMRYGNISYAEAMKQAIEDDKLNSKAELEFSETNVDPDRMELHKKALRIQKKDKIDYRTALIKATRK